MKAIVSTQYADGTWREVGMVGRTIITARSITTIRLRAKAFSNGKPYRLELFAGDRLDGKPYKVEYSK